MVTVCFSLSVRVQCLSNWVRLHVVWVGSRFIVRLGCHWVVQLPVWVQGLSGLPVWALSVCLGCHYCCLLSVSHWVRSVQLGFRLSGLGSNLSGSLSVCRHTVMSAVWAVIGLLGWVQLKGWAWAVCPCPSGPVCSVWACLGWAVSQLGCQSAGCLGLANWVWLNCWVVQGLLSVMSTSAQFTVWLIGLRSGPPLGCLLLAVCWACHWAVWPVCPLSGCLGRH